MTVLSPADPHEMALATAVLAAAALVGRSLLLLGAVDLGLEPRGALTFALSLPDRDYSPPERSAEFARRLEERLAALPHVRSAGAIFGMPFTGFGYAISARALDGRTLEAADADRLTLAVRVATPGYLGATGMRLVAGRNFTGADRAGAPAVVLVNQSAARLLFGGADALGHRIEMGTRLGIAKDWPRLGGEVVGVVADVPANGPAAPAPPTVYAAHAQYPVGFLAFAVRTDGDASALARAIPSRVAELDPNLPVFRIRTLEQLARDSFARQRLTAAVVSVFGLGATLLAGVGIFSLLAYAVASRRRELGVRLALGARPARLAVEVSRGPALLALVGVALGLGAALAAGAFLRGLLFGVAPNDPATLALVAVAATGVALAAVLGPTVRAARLDPSTVLRED
jgi:predicted permease